MLKVNEYRELYEGLTQEGGKFRDAIYALSEQVPEKELFSDLDRAQNRLNYAMLGIHPIYNREVELSGIVDYARRVLYTYAEDGQIETSFDDLDPSYVSFLETQKRIYNVKETMPLSSVALKTSNQWLAKEDVKVPDLSQVQMNLPSDELSFSRKVLETAFARSMVLMNHLQEEIEKHGLDRAYGASREDLIQYVQSNSFQFQFDHSVNELTQAAKEASLMDNMENQ